MLNPKNSGNPTTCNMVTFSYWNRKTWQFCRIGIKKLFYPKPFSSASGLSLMMPPPSYTPLSQKRIYLDSNSKISNFKEADRANYHNTVDWELKPLFQYSSNHTRLTVGASLIPYTIQICVTEWARFTWFNKPMKKNIHSQFLKIHVFIA